MLIYKVTLHDPKTNTTALLAELPERRSDPARKGSKTIKNWIKSLYGLDWYLVNEKYIGIIKCQR